MIGLAGDRVALESPDAFAVVAHVVASNARLLCAFYLAHFVVRARHRFGIDCAFMFKSVRFVGVAVIPVQGPIQQCRTGWPHGRA